jgi:diaminohydroxyphosphoribosylaminopyrimidine deaminase / 5-amino-6-(5-phosphoribosylamino)uracil reductase
MNQLLTGFSHFDRLMMRRAIRIAGKTPERTFPNPKVGCVIAKDNRIIGEGFHRQAGFPHAEIEAMRNCDPESLHGATCYVSLEPCNHFGLTPPCSEALLKAGISRVVFGISDPNPHVNGNGALYLSDHGVRVDGPFLSEEAFELNKAWIKRVVLGLPWITVKMAASLDGKTATCTGETRWISNEESRRFVHKMRSKSDAVLVGSQTVIADNPELTARNSGKITATPKRIIVDSLLRSPFDSRVFQADLPGETILVCTDKTQEDKLIEFEKRNIRILMTKPDRGHVNLEEMMRLLALEGIESVLVEGGRTLVFSLFEKKLVDEICFFYSDQIFGGIDAPGMVGGSGFAEIALAPHLNRIKIKRIKNNFLITGYLREPGDVHRNNSGDR